MGVGTATCSTGASRPQPSSGDRAPRFGDSFWQHWGDGRAELAGYELTYPRYGQPRRGVAVTVFVTEPFSESLRVKADPGRHPDADVLQVLKLNLMRDFPTGIYDYNLMNSVFVALEPRAGRSAGSPTKVSFSSQEWCGHVYQQLLFDDERIRSESHSYFDGEADTREVLAYPAAGVSEDALLHWARHLAAPLVDAGDRVEVPFLPSTTHRRLQHEPQTWTSATLSRAEKTTSISVPAGEVEVRRAEVAVAEGRDWVFWVEVEHPFKIIRWETSDGQRAELTGSMRAPYWKMNDPGGAAALEELGLEPRSPRAP